MLKVGATSAVLNRFSFILEILVSDGWILINDVCFCTNEFLRCCLVHTSTSADSNALATNSIEHLSMPEQCRLCI
jgi:hypothetical protein